jgi:hypothetical protein
MAAATYPNSNSYNPGSTFRATSGYGDIAVDQIGTLVKIMRRQKELQFHRLPLALLFILDRIKDMATR